MIFISGGVRSGKSTFAEQVATRKALEMGGDLHYVATGVPSDEEMKKRIARHQRERVNHFHQWKTWEQPRQIDTLAYSFNKKDVVLLDCLTILLNNELFFEQKEWDLAFLEEVYKRILEGIEAIQKSCGYFILVSNEVSYEAMNGNELVFHYSRILGRLHQEIVKRADLAYLVEAGVPILMKGEV